MPKRWPASSHWPRTKCRSCCCPWGRRFPGTGRRSRAVRWPMCWNSRSTDFPQLVKPVTYGDYDAKNCSSKAGTGAGRFETDSRYVHQEHRVHPQYDGDLRAEPDRVQLMGRRARLMSKALDVKTRDSIGLAVSEVMAATTA